MTRTTQAVLRVLLTDPGADVYSLEIGASTGLPSGTIHPILARLENLGWVRSDWENIDPKAVGRPRRRSYRISDEGLAAARQALAEAHAHRTGLTTRWATAGETG